MARYANKYLLHKALKRLGYADRWAFEEELRAAERAKRQHVGEDVADADSEEPPAELDIDGTPPLPSFDATLVAEEDEVV